MLARKKLVLVFTVFLRSFDLRIEICYCYFNVRYQDTKNNGRFREDVLGVDGIDVTMLIFSGIAQVCRSCNSDTLHFVRSYCSIEKPACDWLMKTMGCYCYTLVGKFLCGLWCVASFNLVFFSK